MHGKSIDRLSEAWDHWLAGKWRLPQREKRMPAARVHLMKRIWAARQLGCSRSFGNVPMRKVGTSSSICRQMPSVCLFSFSSHYFPNTKITSRNKTFGPEPHWALVPGGFPGPKPAPTARRPGSSCPGSFRTTSPDSLYHPGLEGSRQPAPRAGTYSPGWYNEPGLEVHH